MVDKLFLTPVDRDGATHLVFTFDDPSNAGYVGSVIEDVKLDYDMPYVFRWDDGEESPNVCVGRAPDDSKHYKVFKYPSELQASGYDYIPGSPGLFGKWRDYMKLYRANELPADDWFGELDRIDHAARQRRQRAELPPIPNVADRDAVAEWVAKQHLQVDVGVREVRYLPRQSPADEIRLLEINDVIALPDAQPEAVDYGLQIEGTNFRLLVADITSEQLKRDPTRLPRGWSLDGFKSWRRGA